MFFLFPFFKERMDPDGWNAFQERLQLKKKVLKWVQDFLIYPKLHVLSKDMDSMAVVVLERDWFSAKPIITFTTDSTKATRLVLPAFLNPATKTASPAEHLFCSGDSLKS